MAKGIGLILVIIGALLIPASFAFGYPIYTQNRIPSWVGPAIGLIVLAIGAVLLSTGETEGFRPDNKTLKIADNKPCPVCGKEDYTWGMVSSPQLARFRTKTLGSIWSGKPIMARTCDHCGHVELFIKPEH